MKANKMKGRKTLSTKPRLLQVAIRLFARNGYEGVSVDEIVTAARVNKRMVYHYFGSKKALYQAVLQEVYGRLMRLELAVVNPQSSIEEVLELLVRAYFQFLATNPEFVQLLLWENLAQGRHLGAATESFSKAPILQILHQVIKTGVRQGRIHRRLKTEHLLINLIGLCLIYFSNRHTLSQTVGLDLRSRKVLQEGLHQVILLAKYGILSDAPARKR